MAFKQKKQVRNVRNRYLKPGALAQLRYSRITTRSCTDIGKKRVVLDTEKAEDNILHQSKVTAHINTPMASPIRISFHSPADAIKLQKVTVSPKTPQPVEFVSQSGLESLPTDLLVKVLCHLHHDQLKAAFHVSKRIRTAVIVARQFHFNYTTPDRSRQEMLLTRTPLPTEHWPFVSKRDGKAFWQLTLRTPKAPRQGPRPPRLQLMDMKQISAVLFPESTFPSRSIVPPGLPRPVCKPVASTRVLFYEDELCQAVAQNNLR